VPVTGFTDLALAYVPGTLGIYQVLIPATFNPAIGTDYALVVNFAAPGYQNMTWTIAAQVIAATVQRILTCLLVPVSQFRRDFPEFADATKFPESTILYWMAVASLLLNAQRWCDALYLATELYVAHNIVFEAQAQQTSLKGGFPGLSKGAISAESAGQVSINFDTTMTLEKDAGNYNYTVYGQRLWRLIQLFGAGPVQIGPGYGGPGIIVGANYGGGNAWIGPDPSPGEGTFGS
jgi:hypothetical protein